MTADLQKQNQDPPTAFGVGGAGGSFAYADSATGIAFRLTKNRLTADFSAVTRISRMVAESLAPARVETREL